MEAEFGLISSLLVAAGVAALLTGVGVARRRLSRAAEQARRLADDLRREAERERKEILVTAQEKALALEEQADRRERDLDERAAQVEERARNLQRVDAELARQRREVEQQAVALVAQRDAAAAAAAAAAAHEEAIRRKLEQTAGLTAAEARAELVAGIEAEARTEAERIARTIEEEARQNAEAEARNLILQASQRVNIRDVMESTVSFIELPNDEMKGRIIGKEGRNIRALEMATGIDLIVDDTPRSIWISSFDPVRREIARVAIDRLLVDGRIHPARIEEVVQEVAAGIDGLIEEKGHEAAYTLGITDLHPKLARLVGRMRYHTSRGHNLLQHSLEVATIAAHLARELGGRPEVALRAGLLHEIGQVADDTPGHSTLDTAELCARHRESEAVVQAVRTLNHDVPATSLEALLLHTANRLSDNRPGARKENLAVFIERLRRLETIARGFDGVQRAFAVKAGKELRVIVDVDRTRDETAYDLSKQIARAIERELSYAGQIKVSVVRERRAVRFAV